MSYEFKVGDNAVYPGHGVGKILSVEVKEILNEKHTFYNLEILESGMKIMIPKNKVETVGLRPIISNKDADKVIEILQNKDAPVDQQTWNRRYREYMEKIKTGSIYEIAEVLRDLFVLKMEKELSFGERKMLDMARSLIIRELRLAKNDSNLNERSLDQILGQ